MEIKSLNIIEVVWEGPFTINEIKDFKMKKGLYQIYGPHPVNGSNNLLYIGKTEQNFNIRLTNHSKDWVDYESTTVEVFLGLLKEDYSDANRYSLNLDIAEKLLVYYCAPPYNTNLLYDLKDLSSKAGHHTLILNLFKKNLLPFEVSTLWYHPLTWDEKQRTPKSYLFENLKISE